MIRHRRLLTRTGIGYDRIHGVGGRDHFGAGRRLVGSQCNDVLESREVFTGFRGHRGGTFLVLTDKEAGLQIDCEIHDLLTQSPYTGGDGIVSPNEVGLFLLPKLGRPGNQATCILGLRLLVQHVVQCQLHASGQCLVLGLLIMLNPGRGILQRSCLFDHDRGSFDLLGDIVLVRLNEGRQFDERLIIGSRNAFDLLGQFDVLGFGQLASQILAQTRDTVGEGVHVIGILVLTREKKILFVLTGLIEQPPYPRCVLGDLQLVVECRFRGAAGRAHGLVLGHLVLAQGGGDLFDLLRLLNHRGQDVFPQRCRLAPELGNFHQIRESLEIKFCRIRHSVGLVLVDDAFEPPFEILGQIEDVRDFPLDGTGQDQIVRQLEILFVLSNLGRPDNQLTGVVGRLQLDLSLRLEVFDLPFQRQEFLLLGPLDFGGNLLQGLRLADHLFERGVFL